MKTLEFWFDFSCPYAFLASRQVAALAAQGGATLSWRPMLLGGVFAAIGAGQGPMATLSATRRDYVAADVARCAAGQGLIFSTPAQHPMRTVLALRSLLALPKANWPRAIAALFDAYWLEHRDISQRGVVEAVLASACEDAPLARMAVEGSERDEIKALLRTLTDEAVAAGIFGAPTYRVLDESGAHAPLFWGQDRLSHVAAALLGWDGNSPRAESAPWQAPTKARGTSTAPLVLSYYFDFASPFAYLGATQVQRIAANLGATVAWRPFLLGGLFRNIGTVDVPLLVMPAAKRAYYLADFARWAAWWDVPFSFPATFPVKTTAPLRIAMAALEQLTPDRAVAWIKAAFEALWVHGRDLNDDGVLQACLVEAALPMTLLAEATSESRKQALIAATNEAAAHGVFGAPTIVVSAGPRETLIWGQDRWDLVAAAARDLASATDLKH
ncbi:MAG: 2-hydroxychromene-2-carboxylate isomerase [Myxococcales bacterium]|nr:2-hydroxychromene-2-carboxylate isomerase [Myxococcales bacterium]